MLEERIRQIQLWSSNKRMGKEIPDGVPDEYVVSKDRLTNGRSRTLPIVVRRL